MEEALGRAGSVASGAGAADQAQLIQSRPVAALAAKEIGRGSEAGSLLESVSVSSTASSGLLQVTATAPSGARAARVANAFVAQYTALRSAQIRDELDRAISSTKRRISAIPSGSLDAAERQDLRATLARLSSARVLALSQVRVVERAVAPSSPSAPKPLRDALFAFVISLLLAVALAFGLQRFDHRLKRPQDAEAAFGVPFLSAIPHAPSNARETDAGVQTRHARAIQINTLCVLGSTHLRSGLGPE